RRPRLPARGAAGRGAGSGPAAERMPLPSSVPVRVRPVPAGRAAARCAGRRPTRGVLAAARRRCARAARDTRHSAASRIGSESAPHDPRGGTVKRLLLLLGVVAALVSAVAAYGASKGGTAAPTLVVDRSFEIKTSDPQRAFEPTAAIVDRAVYDTLFTYK